MKASSGNKIKSAQGATTSSYLFKGLVQRGKFGVREHPLLPPPEKSEEGRGKTTGIGVKAARSPGHGQPGAFGLGGRPAPEAVRCAVLYQFWLKTKGRKPSPRLRKWLSSARDARARLGKRCWAAHSVPWLRKEPRGFCRAPAEGWQ